MIDVYVQYIDYHYVFVLWKNGGIFLNKEVVLLEIKYIFAA